MKPLIVSNAPRDVEEQFLHLLREQIQKSIGAINANARTDQYPHRFSLRLVEVNIDYVSPERHGVMYRVLSSLRAKEFSVRVLDSRKKYHSTTVHPGNAELSVDPGTMQDVARWADMLCHHRYRDHLASYAKSLGLAPHFLLGEHR